MTQQKNNPHFEKNRQTPLHVEEGEWKTILSEKAFDIAIKKGTERPFTGSYLSLKDKGTYYCKLCGNALFKSDSKFDSGCGWPSFFKAISPKSIIYTPDHSLGMSRTEIQCSACHAHLGHVFEDGPPPTGLRYCLNSEVLFFDKE